MAVAVDAARLLRSIVIAPDAPPWFEKLVRQAALSYGIKAPVRRSKLAFLSFTWRPPEAPRPYLNRADDPSDSIDIFRRLIWRKWQSTRIAVLAMLLRL
jgi:hypothetical protein